MASEQSTPRLAVLIDAENVSAKIADGLFKAITNVGEANVRRIYGNFSGTQLKAWADPSSRHAIKRRQQTACTTGKNASDIALAVDAMDLLHNDHFDAFCIVSSDSDFTPLAKHISKHRIDVYGFGEKKTPMAFRRACRQFTDTVEFLPKSQKTTDPGVKKRPLSLNHAKDQLTKVIAQMGSENKWVSLSQVGKQLKNVAPNFDPRTYGHKNLSSLVKMIGTLELRTAEKGHLIIRMKP